MTPIIKNVDGSVTLVIPAHKHSFVCYEYDAIERACGCQEVDMARCPAFPRLIPCEARR